MNAVDVAPAIGGAAHSSPSPPSTYPTEAYVSVGVPEVCAPLLAPATMESRAAPRRSCNRCIVALLTLLVLVSCALLAVRLFSAAEQGGDERESGHDLFLSMQALVPDDRYSLEEHFATTADGYVLRLFRLRSTALSGPLLEAAATAARSTQAHGDAAAWHASRNSSQPLPLEQHHLPVFMHHALMDSSAGFLVLGVDRGLGFKLADAGFDVWLGNARGNRFSRNHTTLLPHMPDFWEFSFDEHAMFDIPAAIDTVLRANGAPMLHYLGYSQGTTVALAALSSQPAVAQRVASAALMAPIAVISHLTSWAFKLGAQTHMHLMLEAAGVHEYGPHTPGNAKFMRWVCDRCFTCCEWSFWALCGKNPTNSYGNIDHATVQMVNAYLPAGTSVRNMEHWGQAVLSKEPRAMRRYSYGTDCSSRRHGSDDDEMGAVVGGGARAGGSCNQEVYGTDVPPAYNLSSITTPMALFYGGKDALSQRADLEILLETLPAGTVQLQHYEENYAHLDFGLGADAHERLYPAVVQFLTTQDAAWHQQHTQQQRLRHHHQSAGQAPL